MDQHPVLQAINHRCRTGSIPGRRDDDFKIALVIEGGAMRGVVSAGMVAALEYLRLLPAFDVVYGTSAGAINGAYFRAGQAALGTTIYYEKINNSQFVNRVRTIFGDPLVSLDFLFEQVMTKEEPLDWERVVNCPIELVPIGTSIRSGEAILLRGARSRDTLFLRLKASSRIPLLAGPPIRVGGEGCFDGGLAAPIPVRPALEEGCTHVLALLTKPFGTPRSTGSRLSRYRNARRLARYSPQLSAVFLDRPDRYARDVDWLTAQTWAASARAPYTCAIQPSRGTPVVKSLETNRKRLISGARSGVESILTAFGKPETLWNRVLWPDSESLHRAMRTARLVHCGTGMTVPSPDMDRRRGG
jgi:predicted patatin/cPLA2 family phospholipase